MTRGTWILPALFALFLPLSVSAADWSKVNCPSPEKLAEDFLRAEVSGWRVLQAQPSCVDPKLFPYFEVVPLTRNTGFGKPDTLNADEKKPYEIIEVKSLGDNQYLVRFNILVNESGRIRKVEDALVFRRYLGAMKASSGCAGVINEPENFFVRRSCLKR